MQWLESGHVGDQSGWSPILPVTRVHLSSEPDTRALHKSETLPFPNPERKVVLDEIFKEVQEGKVLIEGEGMGLYSGAGDVLFLFSFFFFFFQFLGAWENSGKTNRETPQSGDASEGQRNRGARS